MKPNQTCQRFGNDNRGFSLVELLVSMAILVLILGVVSWIARGVQQSYALHRPRMEAVNDASAAMDTIVRLLRMAGNNPGLPPVIPPVVGLDPIHPDPDGDGVYNSIRIQADWNPVNGTLTNTFEDVRFSVSNGTLFKQEPGDTGPVPFLEQVGSLTFTYFDKNNNPIANAVVNRGQIARADIVLVTRTPNTTPMTINSSVHLRRR